MSAFERTLKYHLVSYRNNRICFIFFIFKPGIVKSDQTWLGFWAASRSFPTHIARTVARSVCLPRAQTWAVQKLVNRSRRCTLGRLVRPKASFIDVQIANDKLCCCTNCGLHASNRAAVGMGISMGMGAAWVWGLWWVPMGLWGLYGDFRMGVRLSVSAVWISPELIQSSL